MRRSRRALSGFLALSFLASSSLFGQTLKQIRDSGARDNRINIVVFSEGYQAAELTTKFPADAEAAVAKLLGTEPYREYASYINVFTIAIASAQSGSDHPALGQFKQTYFNSSYDSFGLDRLLTIPPNDFDPDYAHGLGKVDALLAQLLPDYDLALMIVNDQSYGGSGGPVAIVSVNEFAADVAIHETGHTFAGLADEYDTPAPSDPFEAPNATQETARAKIGWHDWILASTPIPTPEDPIRFSTVIGLFEGANYHQVGWYRPKFQCKMNSLDFPFCEVCSEALVLNIYRRLSIVDAATPELAEEVNFTTSESRTFMVTALQSTVSNISAQWFVDEVAIDGVTGDFLVLHGAALNEGAHGVRVELHDDTELVRTDRDDLLSKSVHWTVNITPGTTPPPQLLNISTRMQVSTADNVLIGGFISTGTVPKKVLLRALGPSLAGMGITGGLADPLLELHKPDGTVVTNDDWKDTQQDEIEATGIPPSNLRESAIVATLDPGAYTAVVRGSKGGAGVGLVEIYDISDSAGATLANISTRGFVETADKVMIGGLILGGDDSKVLVRALGPSLSVAGALADPTLELYDAEGVSVATNDNWKSDQLVAIRATGIPPSKDAESAIVATLAPGAYTAIVRGENNTTGVALVEVYQLDE